MCRKWALNKIVESTSHNTHIKVSRNADLNRLQSALAASILLLFFITRAFAVQSHAKHCNGKWTKEEKKKKKRPRDYIGYAEAAKVAIRHKMLLNAMREGSGTLHSFIGNKNVHNKGWFTNVKAIATVHLPTQWIERFSRAFCFHSIAWKMLSKSWLIQRWFSTVVME